MTREQAYEEMKNGRKISHRYFASDEYYHIQNGKIIAEDGVNHTSVFWSEEDNNFRSDGWYIKE